jgi:protein-tyrosine phosphatase
MAEVVLRAELEQAGLASRVEVDSAGTGDWHVGGPMDPGARAQLSLRGYDGSGHRARQFQPSWFSRYDLITAMDARNLANLRAMAPDEPSAARIRLFRSFDPALAGLGTEISAREGQVPDPFNGSPADYALAFELVAAAAQGLAGQLAELLTDGRAQAQ